MPDTPIAPIPRWACKDLPDSPISFSSLCPTSRIARYPDTPIVTKHGISWILFYRIYLWRVKEPVPIGQLSPKAPIGQYSPIGPIRGADVATHGKILQCRCSGTRLPEACRRHDSTRSFCMGKETLMSHGRHIASESPFIFF